jgi:hypothetical protein
VSAWGRLVEATPFGMARKAPIPSKCVGQIEHVALLSKSHLCGRGRWPVVSVIRAASGVPNVPAGFPILFDADMAIIEPAFVWLMEHAELSAVPTPPKPCGPTASISTTGSTRSNNRGSNGAKPTNASSPPIATGCWRIPHAYRAALCPDHDQCACLDRLPLLWLGAR